MSIVWSKTRMKRKEFVLDLEPQVLYEKYQMGGLDCMSPVVKGGMIITREDSGALFYYPVDTIVHLMPLATEKD